MITGDLIQESFQAIVNTAKTEVLTTLQDADSNIVTVGYKYGGYDEVRRQVKEESTLPASVDRTYPLVMLLGNIPISPSAGGYAGEVTLQLFIVYPIAKQATPQEAIANVFKPILRPLYNALMKAIVNSGVFVLYSVNDLAKNLKYVEDVDVQEALLQSSADRVCAIAIQDMKLTISSEDQLTRLLFGFQD